MHLELHTSDLAEAERFYRRLCGWRLERVATGVGEYAALQLSAGDDTPTAGESGALGGGIVECSVRSALWLPYVEVPEIRAATTSARALGARVLLDCREGPAGWRSVIATPATGELALWQQKR